MIANELKLKTIGKHLSKFDNGFVDHIDIQKEMNFYFAILDFA